MLRWIPTRWRRFSIRTLLVAITVAGAISGLVGIHYRNRWHQQSVRQLIASAHCQSIIFFKNRGRLQLDPAFSVEIQIPIDALTPEGFVALQHAADRIAPHRNQTVDCIFLTRSVKPGIPGNSAGKADLPRIQQALARFAPRQLQLRRLNNEETTFILNNSQCQSIELINGRDWTNNTSIEMRCRELDYKGSSFAKFWRCVSPGSLVAKLYIDSQAPAELQGIFPTSLLQEVEIVTGHMDECDIAQLMSRLEGVYVKLNCCGVDGEQAERLRETFAPNLFLEPRPCTCNSDPFN